MELDFQLFMFVAITLVTFAATWMKCSKAGRRDNNAKGYFLAGRKLGWFYIAGAITLTNLSTDQLVGMNGNQMLLLAWWELSALVGLLILAYVFVPIYYKHGCTTTTELLEKKYNNKHIRGAVGTIFLLGNVFIYQPIVLYTGALTLRSLFGLDVPLVMLVSVLAILGGSFAIFGGLRAVAIYDTYCGILILPMLVVLVVVSLAAVNFDLSGIPMERLSMIGDSNSPIPWHTLLTGMLFIQIFYWSTNQVITQKALAAPSIRQAQYGILGAMAVRLFIVVPAVSLPGVLAWKLYGELGDSTFGYLVANVMPGWLSGTFAAAMFGTVLTSYCAQLNASASLYVCDIHQRYLNADVNVRLVGGLITLLFMFISVLMLPAYNGAASIINLVQELNGLLSMPILSTFITGLLFRNVSVRAVLSSLIFGVLLYAFFTFVWMPLHYIHMMFLTLGGCVVFALSLNRWVFGQHAEIIFSSLRLPWREKNLQL